MKKIKAHKTRIALENYFMKMSLEARKQSEQHNDTGVSICGSEYTLFS